MAPMRDAKPNVTLDRSFPYSSPLHVAFQWGSECLSTSILPSEDLIDYWTFLRSIAKATLPDVRVGATGLACITGKVVAQRIPGVEETLLSEEPLTSEDRRVLRQLLPKLPELRVPLSEDVIGAFTSAYRALDDRPAWEPVLITLTYAYQRKVTAGCFRTPQEGAAAIAR